MMMVNTESKGKWKGQGERSNTCSTRINEGKEKGKGNI